MPKRLWVAGWSAQLLLITVAAICLWFGHATQASAYVTGCVVIGVIRQIEKDRRASDDAATSPTPRSKV